jgi:hypothetical protein
LLVLDLLVALKGDSIDDRIFDDGDDEASALNGRNDVLKQSCGEEGFDAFVDLEGVEAPARS